VYSPEPDCTELVQAKQNAEPLNWGRSMIFRSSSRQEVASTWFDAERRMWALSTVPVVRFDTEQEAIDFYWNRCDPETGLIRSRWICGNGRLRSAGSAEAE
jgi:hypothetical protein